MLERLREGRTLYDALMARALRLASSTFEDMTGEPVVFIQGTSLLLEDVGDAAPEVTLGTLRTLLRMIEEKTRLVQLLDDYMGSGGYSRDRQRTSRRRHATVQPRRLDLFGRARAGASASSA